VRLGCFSTAALSAAVVLWASHGSAASRSSPASCREAINGLISLLDSGKDNDALYRDTFDVVVNTCGPARRSSKLPQTARGRAACHDLAAAMVDLIEDDKVDSVAFIDARDTFARSCAPRAPR
jgi:hypothetical protein